MRTAKITLDSFAEYVVDGPVRRRRVGGEAGGSAFRLGGVPGGGGGELPSGPRVPVRSPKPCATLEEWRDRTRYIIHGPDGGLR